MQAGKDIRWQVRIDSGDDTNNFSGVVRLEQNDEVKQAIQQAYSDLEKARIYAGYFYWYDAFDAYTQWLDANPSDLIARRERSAMMNLGLVNVSSIKLKCNPVIVPIDRIESQKSESLQLSPRRF
ncbi:hypothetical protein TUMEXPCC7403_20695 [Tumidithrix helvetica PCC 7403]